MAEASSDHAYNREPRWRSSDYHTRFLGGMIASLALILGIVHLPIDPAPRPVGWHLTDVLDRESIDVRDVPSQTRVDAGVPVTRFETEESDEAEGDRSMEEEAVEETVSSPDRSRRIPGLKVHSAAPQMPEIVGGLGAFYVHIQYPERAVRERVEGRLKLSFIVNAEGGTEDIRVIESLHPACDSAAVAALKKTRFVPARSEGEVVPVRMHLPVRFRLVSSR